MLLRFCSAFGREVAMGLQPITYNGTVVRLERQEETDNRFIRVPNWLVLVHVWDYPEEHWDEDKVRSVFSCIRSIMEIDPECLTAHRSASSSSSACRGCPTASASMLAAATELLSA